MAGTGNRPARERFDFSLDARQVAGVILGSLGALALAFFLGHALGQRVAERPAAPPVASTPAAARVDGLDALDNPPRLEKPETKNPDTFHDTLVSASPPPDRLPAVPKASAPATKPAPVAPPAQLAATPSAAPAPSGPSGPSGTTGLPAPSGAVGGNPVKSSPPPAPPVAPSVAAAPGTGASPVPAPTAAVVPKAAPPPPALRKGASEKGAWVVQVGSTQERFEADRIAARYAGRGARVTVADVPGKGRWYRVRLGSFDTREAADRYLKDLERTTGARGFVASAN
jgi:DedD protein